MGAVAYRLRSTLLHRWPSLVMLIVITAGVSGVALSLAAGAHRTDTVVDRFTSARGGDVDAIVVQQDGGQPITDQLRSLPAVESAESLTFVFAAVIPAGADAPVDALPFVGSVESVRGRVIAGRAANSNVAGEFVATPSFIASAGASVGDTFQLVSLTQDEAFQGGFFSQTQSGPTLTAQLVGIIESPAQIQDPTPTVIFSHALLAVQGDGGALGLSQSNIAVDLRDGVDVSDLRQQLNSLPGSESLAIGSGNLVDDDLRKAVNTQAVGLWILAAIGAAAAMMLLGQLVLRMAQVTDVERERLTSIGVTNRGILAESLGRALFPIVIGCALGMAAALVPSGLLPTGLARKYEPHPGVSFDALALPLGALSLMLALTVWTGVALRLGSRPPVAVTRPSSLERLAARSPSAVASTGLRFAFGRRRTGRSAATGAVVAIATSVAILVSALVFGFSMNRLIDQPARYGVNFDLAAGDNGSGVLSNALLEVVSNNSGITSAVLYSGDHARRDDADVDLLGLQQLRGSSGPVITTGRLPVSPEEVVLGRTTARDLDVSIGDSIELSGVTGSATFRVIGFAVIPGLGANEGVGKGALLTMEGLSHLHTAAQPNVVAVRFASGLVGEQAFRDVVAAAGEDPAQLPFRPAVIANVDRVRDIPFVLALVVGVLGMLTVVNVVFASVRHRRRELAILRSLGADGGWIVRAVHCQATLLCALPSVIGAGIGIMLGRKVFIAFAGNLGAVDVPSVPSKTTALLLVALALVANLAALAPSNAVRRVAPAEHLHVE